MQSTYTGTYIIPYRLGPLIKTKPSLHIRAYCPCNLAGHTCQAAILPYRSLDPRYRHCILAEVYTKGGLQQRGPIYQRNKPGDEAGMPVLNDAQKEALRWAWDEVRFEAK